MKTIDLSKSLNSIEEAAHNMRELFSVINSVELSESSKRGFIRSFKESEEIYYITLFKHTGAVSLEMIYNYFFDRFGDVLIEIEFKSDFKVPSYGIIEKLIGEFSIGENVANELESNCLTLSLSDPKKHLIHFRPTINQDINSYLIYWFQKNPIDLSKIANIKTLNNE